MKKNKFVGRLILPVLYAPIGFFNYLATFDGAYTNVDLLWGGVIAVVLGVAIFMYFPIAQKIDHFSPAWFFVLLIFLGLLGLGWVLSSTHFPLPYTAWGNYAFSFAVLIPVIHQLFHYAYRCQKGSFFKRVRLKPTDDAQA